MERFAKIAATALSHVVEPLLKRPLTSADLESPPDPSLGDFGFPCFRLAKELRKAPPVIASEFAKLVQEQGKLPPSIAVSSAGPYVNFTVAPAEVAQAVLGDILKDTSENKVPYGALASGSRGTWVLEYSSPNVAKPLNIYHLRPTALGAALDRIGRFRGFKVISINHLGDWGKQYGMLTVAFRVFGKTLQDQLSMMELVDLYVKINAEVEKHPEYEDEAREAFLKLEKGDPAVTALWKKCVEVSIKEFERIYSRLAVKFDHIWGESFYKEQLAPLLEDLRKRNILVESEGAWVIPVHSRDGKELPPCLMQKNDGATIYATRDVAAAVYRYEKFHFDRMTYIVGSEQRMHFEQVFGALRAMGCKWEPQCEHVPSGLYRFKDAKMSTRKGNFVTLEDVLAQAKERVIEILSTRENKNLSESEIKETAEAVAVGAVVFHDLATDPARDVDFDLERVVDFEGETGPYLQYAHTRCLSILRKAAETGVTFSKQPDFNQYTHPAEISLIKVLGQFPLHLERSLQFAKANQLANYLIDVTKAYGLFYRECKVLGEAPQTVQARLALVEASRRILDQGLTLLGVPLPQKM